MPGVEVTLIDSDGNVVATTTTDTDGNYSFTDLPSGDYVVVISTPEGEGISPQNQGSDDTSDSDADLVTGQIPVSVDPGETSTNNDAGLQTEIIDLTVEIEVDATVVGEGDTVTYTVTGSNSGNTPVTGTQMTTTLPEGVTFVSSQTELWECEVEGQVVTCEHDGTLMPGEEAPPVEITTYVSTPGPLTAETTINPVGTDMTESDVTNNDDDVLITAVAAPETLAFTGGISLGLLLLSVLLVLTGTCLTFVGRRRTLAM